MREYILKITEKERKHERGRFDAVSRCKDKVIANAHAKYAYNAARGELLAVYDITVFGSGKEGFALTSSHIYTSLYDGGARTKYKKHDGVSIVGLEKVGEDKKDKGYLVFSYSDGSEALFYASVYAPYIKCFFFDLLRARDKGEEEKSSANKLKETLALAESGDKRAIWEVARMYRTNRDFSLAEKWFRIGMDKGDVMCILGLADMYRFGSSLYGAGCPQSNETAIELYRKAAAMGDGQAVSTLRALGVAYQADKNEKPAVESPVKEAQKPTAEPETEGRHELEKEYANRNYSRVIAIFREVIKDESYTVAEKMKYCHIAADCVCKTAKTVREFEEARTWASILEKRDGAYKDEAKELRWEIEERSGGLLEKQSEWMAEVSKALEERDIEYAKKIMTNAGNNGSFAALNKLAEFSIAFISNKQDLDDTRKVIEKIKRIDSYSAAGLEKEFEASPRVRYIKHTERAAYYREEAIAAKGKKRIESINNAIEESVKAYNASPNHGCAKFIMELYISVANYEKEYYSEDDMEMMCRYIKYLMEALKWGEIAAESGDPKVLAIVQSLNKMLDSFGEYAERLIK